MLRVGGLARAQLIAALDVAEVRLNEYARTLLADEAFGDTSAQTIAIVQCSVGESGLSQGGPLPQILERARRQGLLPCPPTTGPYLRLAALDQPTAPDSVLSAGRAPTGSVTVASERLRDDDEYPRGFYLRVIDGQSWLRGYRCDDEHPWSAGDWFAFRLETRGR